MDSTIWMIEVTSISKTLVIYTCFFDSEGYFKLVYVKTSLSSSIYHLIGGFNPSEKYESQLG